MNFSAARLTNCQLTMYGWPSQNNCPPTILNSREAEFAPLSEEVKNLADSYQSRQILSPRFYNDSLHIALATVAEVDVLVSWNFKHIVHLDKIRRFNALNQEHGYKSIDIYSPR